MKIKRIAFGKNTLLLLTCVCMLFSCTKKNTLPHADNILFILVDDHALNMLSSYGGAHISTPNIDRIAENGYRFVNSFVANASAKPSLSTLLTGKHSHAHGVIDNTISSIPNNQNVLPELLRESGYKTALIGRWPFDNAPVGFDEWDIMKGDGDYYQPDFTDQNNQTIRHEGYSTNIITDLTIRWLEENKSKDAPFFLMTHHKAADRNRMPDIDHLDLFENMEFPVPDNFNDPYVERLGASSQEISIDRYLDLVFDLKLRNRNGSGILSDEYHRGMERLSSEQKSHWDRFYDEVCSEFDSEMTNQDTRYWKYQRFMRDYAKTLYSLDQNVGRILDYLKESGLDKNTTVIYTSLHGVFTGQHGWFSNGFMYEESMKTPLLIRFSSGTARKKTEIRQMVQNIDFAPTILDLLDMDIPSDMQGKSFLSAFRDSDAGDTSEKTLYYHYYEYPSLEMIRRHCGIRTPRYKLIHFYNDIDYWELYDLEKDPSEMTNLIDDAEKRTLVEELKQEMNQMQELYKDPIRVRIN